MNSLALLLFVTMSALSALRPLVTPVSSVPAANPAKALDFFNVLGKLKMLKRTGWVNHEIAQPESVADHMYRMSMLSFLITDPAVQRDELVKICLLHDLAEAEVGDIIPGAISRAEKRVLEETALRTMLADIGHAGVAEEMLGLWMQYEEGDSPTAQCARQLDKFEMVVQADEYEKVTGRVLEPFFASTAGFFSHPEICAWDAALRARRTARLASADLAAGNA